MNREQRDNDAALFGIVIDQRRQCVRVYMRTVQSERRRRGLSVGPLLDDARAFLRSMAAHQFKRPVIVHMQREAPRT